MLPGAATLLASDACGFLDEWSAVDFRLVADSVTGAECSVSGAYVEETEPPVIAVAASASSGRRAFTALHELGHHLQRTIFELMDPLLTEPDGGTLLEDAACDAFAAGILLPDQLVDRHVPAAGPTVTDVAGLAAGSAASRAAVCIRTSERLRSPGHVVLLDRDGVVQFAAAHGLPPLPRFSDQSRVPAVARALASERLSATGRSRFLYRDGIRSQELLTQIGGLRNYLVAIAVVDRAPWTLDFELPPRGTRPEAPTWLCENAVCGHTFTAFGRPCDACGAHRCPDCGACRCGGKAPERQCGGCRLTYPLRFFDEGSSLCQDCA
jgi:hypothetical protein